MVLASFEIAAFRHRLARPAPQGRRDQGRLSRSGSNSNAGVWAKQDDGTNKPEHTHWHGFQNRTAKGLRYEVLKAGE
jgi:hypothetical protein